MLKDYLQLHLIVFIWGFTSIIGKKVGIDPIHLVWLRGVITFFAIALIFSIMRKSLKINRKGLLMLIGNGTIVGLHWIFFYESVQLSTVSICLAGLSTTSLMTSLIEPLLTKRKFQYYELFLGLFVIVGLYVIFLFEFNHFLGLLLALFAAFFGTLFSVINVYFASRYSAHKVSMYEMLGVVLICTILLPFYQLFWNNSPELYVQVPSEQDWYQVLLLALVCTVYPFIVSVDLLKRLTAFHVNLTVNLEPVYGMILAALLLAEHKDMTSGFYIGTGIIFLSVMSYPFLKKRFERS